MYKNRNSLFIYKTSKLCEKEMRISKLPGFKPGGYVSLKSLASSYFFHERLIQDWFSNGVTPHSTGPASKMASRVNSANFRLTALSWLTSGLKTSLIMYFPNTYTPFSDVPSTQFIWYFRCLLFNLRQNCISYFEIHNLTSQSNVNT